MSTSMRNLQEILAFLFIIDILITPFTGMQKEDMILVEDSSFDEELETSVK